MSSNQYADQRQSQRIFVWVALIRTLPWEQGSAENRLEYRYEDYREENGRVHVRTHGVGFQHDLSSKITAKGLLVYDGISGATPTGEFIPLGKSELPTSHLEDIRRAATIDLAVRYGRHTTTPQLSISEERDYDSKGLALNHTIDFNQKNTTLTLGASRNFDQVGGGFLSEFQKKESGDFLIGFNQLIDSKTVLTANLTLGYSHGFLNDPYRSVSFILPDSPDSIFSDPGSVNAVAERRPTNRFKQVGYVSITRYIEPLNASVDGSYRFYHDDWGITANTCVITWHQKVGKRITLSPLFRFYHQSSASFYAPWFKGVSFDQYSNGTRIAFQEGAFLAFEDEPGFPQATEAGMNYVDAPAHPNYFSADYRLAELDAITFGIAFHGRLAEKVGLELAVKRYEMIGRDGVTPSGAFPAANIVTLGIGLWF